MGIAVRVRVVVHNNIDWFVMLPISKTLALTTTLNNYYQ